MLQSFHASFFVLPHTYQLSYLEFKELLLKQRLLFDTRSLIYTLQFVQYCKDGGLVGGLISKKTSHNFTS